jgi:PAS domain S-box-containing protein
MELDTQTILFLRTPVAIFAALMVCLFGRSGPALRGTGTWAIATLCVGATGILFSARSSLPYSLTVVAANVLYVTGAALFHLAACRLRKARFPSFLHIVIVLVILFCSGFLFRDLKADYVARVLVFCPAIALQFFLVARTLIANRTAVAAEEYKVLAFGSFPFALIGLGLIWRTIIHIPGVVTSPDGLLSNQVNAQITNIATMLALMFTPFVFIQINSVRARLLAQDNESRLRRQTDLLEHAPVLVRNMNDEIILWNRGMEKLYGFQFSDAMGKVSHNLLQSRFPCTLHETRKAISVNSRWEGELRHIRSDGSSVWVSSVQVLHLEDHGNPAAIIEINNDITELKLAEEELRKKNVDLTHMNRVMVGRELRMVELKQEVDALCVRAVSRCAMRRMTKRGRDALHASLIGTYNKNQKPRRMQNRDACNASLQEGLCDPMLPINVIS